MIGRSRIGHTFVAVAIFLSTAWSLPIHAQASFAGLGVLTGEEAGTTATQVSGDGATVVGIAMQHVNLEDLQPEGVPEGTGFTVENENVDDAWRWTSAGGLQPFARLPVTAGGRALGVSGDGSVIVGEAVLWGIGPDEKPPTKAVRWTAATGLAFLTGLPEDAEVSGAIGVSGDGSVVVGYMDTEDGIQAFRWTATTGPVGLGFFPNGVESRAMAISTDGTVVVGWAHHQDGIRAFRWTAQDGMQNLGILDGGTRSRALSVSADGGVVVGSVENGDGTERAFRWTVADGMAELAPPEGSTNCMASAVSADGAVVVGSWASEEAAEAFVWDAATGMRSLKSILEAAQVNIEGWSIELAMGVSADGRTIVGVGTNPDGASEAWRAVLPAP